VDDIVKQLINTKRELVKGNDSKDEQRPPNDLLELLISIRDDETGMAFTDEDLTAHVKT
jgi:cytochrome P450